MSKIRGKVIGGTATTPINVDAFIKKSLETGGAINKAIKSNSGVKTVTIPEGEVSTTSILEMEEGVYLLKGMFRYFPNYAYYDNTINFEREVIACVTKSEGEDDFHGGLVYWERKHLWYFDATANNNTGSQVIITVKYDKGVDDLYDYSVKYTPNKYLEYSSYKQTKIDDLFYSRIEDEEGRTEFYPSIGVMADYVTKAIEEGASEANQIQADWAQMDDTQVDYIKNKPKFNTALSSSVADNILYLNQQNDACVVSIESNILVLS